MLDQGPEVPLAVSELRLEAGVIDGMWQAALQVRVVALAPAQIVLSAVLNGRDTEIRLFGRGDHHDRQSRDRGQRPIDGLEPSAVRQLELQQHGVEARTFELRYCLSERQALLHLDGWSGRGEGFTQQGGMGLVVFDEQHADRVVWRHVGYRMVIVSRSGI